MGQEGIVGEGTALRAAIEKDRLGSMILAGPPGTGKTTLARIIAVTTEASFVQLNAVTSGVKDLKAVCEEAQRLQETFGTRTVLFIDEIHRFNTAQQDALLPYVERGTVTLIGATTQNPFFDVNPALVSRSRVCLLQPLAQEEVMDILRRAVEDDRGFGGKVKVPDAALRHLATVSNGDARVALNALELAAITAGGKVTVSQAQKLFGERHMRYDKAGEEHYDTVSAFIKSMRGSDPDAALLWLYKMLQSGEDPRFLFRRMAIFASEDVGNADPRALPLVVSAWQAFELVGLPEGEYFLAHACVYLSQAPKSNAVTRAMGAAKAALQSAPSLEVPNHLRNAPVKGMAAPSFANEAMEGRPSFANEAMEGRHGYGKGYQYPHDAEDGVVRERYFPLGMEPRDFYMPTGRGFEREVEERMENVKKLIR